MRRSVVPSLLLVAIVLLSGVVAGARAVPHPDGLGLALTASTSSGSAPLVVGFLATLTPASTVAAFDWSFGDGSYYNVSARGSSSPAHSYTAVGVYHATVSVTSSSGDANASLVIDVVAENLVVTIVATPTGGSAPLTVNFLASISGGTGTYESILWNFGDGDSGSGPDLNYTYPVAGTFKVNLTVADSSGHEVSDQSTIDVSVARTNGSNVPQMNGLVAAVPYALAAAGLLALVAVLAITYRSLVRRRAEAVGAPPGALQGAPGAAGLEGTAAAPPPAGPVTPPAPLDPSGGSGPGTALDDSRRLSERILIHLLWYGRSGAEGVARAEASQQGMARALGSGQNTISKALSRLRDAGAVRVELQHVPGAPRRVKTYSLTPRGEAVARSLTRGPGDTGRDPGNRP